MARVIPFSQTFPAYHARKGQQTHFVEKFWNSFNGHFRGEEYLMDFTEQVWMLNKHLPYSLVSDFLKRKNAGKRELLGQKNHTIREGHRWKAGDFFSPRVWSGVPYHSKQIIIANNTEVVKTWDFELRGSEYIFQGKELDLPGLKKIAKNDGLSSDELELWFRKPFTGQVICWNKETSY